MPETATLNALRGSFEGAGRYRNQVGHELNITGPASAAGRGRVVLGAIWDGWLDVGKRTGPTSVLVTPEWVVAAGFRPHRDVG